MAAEFTTGAHLRTDHSTPLRFIWSHIRRHPMYGILMIVGAFANAALAALVPWLIGQAFNAVSANEPMTVIAALSVGIIISQLLRASLQLMRNFSAEVFAQRIERDVRDELYASLLGKSMTFHDLHKVGEIMARVTNDVRELNLMMNPGMNLLIGSGMFLIVPVLAAPAIYPSLIIPPAVFLVFYAWGIWHYLKLLNPVAEQVRTDFGAMNGNVEETLEGLLVVKGAAQEAAEEAEFHKRVEALRIHVVAQYDIEARYLPFLFFSLVVFVSFVWASVLYLQGLITTGDIVAYVGQIGLFGFPVFSSIQSLSQVSLGYASARRILELINTETELDQNSAGQQATVQGAITFEGVSFAYREGEGPVLQDISFAVQPGQRVAIVGQTGSGKSSVAKLINRIYDVDAGHVRVDGVDVREWNMASLRSQVSVIEQDIFLFSRSIADNIRFGKPDATLDEVIEAAQKAQAHEFILEFPDGYDTVVGQRGVTLSGGQRQRIALARAFVSDPPILILDDSTSAIDSATEDRIQKAIWAVARGRTTLLITHRLSQIRWADHIIVMKSGRVVAQGTHDDLMETSSAYRRIFARYEGGRTRATGELRPVSAEG
jgi:ATP-binding cassette, subfamily B, bacterial